MNIEQVKTLLNDRFGEYHLFDIIDPEDEPEYIWLAFIAHENMQKDVWITENGIDRIINVPYDHMGTDEQTRWNEYIKKQE